MPWLDQISPDRVIAAAIGAGVLIAKLHAVTRSQRDMGRRFGEGIGALRDRVSRLEGKLALPPIAPPARGDDK